MIPPPVLALETIVVIVAGVLTDSPLVSAIIGGLFLVIGAGINSVTLYLIARDERKRDTLTTRAQKKRARRQAARGPKPSGGTNGTRGTTTRRGSRDADD